MANKARHAFGSEANIDAALRSGSIDAYDILFLDEKKIGWIDKNGEKVILEDPKQVSVATSLPESGAEGILYITISKDESGNVMASGSIWNESEYICVFSSDGNNGVDETVVDDKINNALSIVEF